MSQGRVPVVMYHSVGPPKPGWRWNHLVTPLGVFDGQMRRLAEEGWTTLHLGEVLDHMMGAREVPERSVVLTFDDGYADNWTHAHPILEHYGLKATVFVSSDFVDPGSEARPTIQRRGEGWEAGPVEDARGFLRWPEMRALEAAGTFEIQSHAATHTWYPAGDEVVDFHRPEGVAGYRTPYWLAWNHRPERKPHYMSEALDRLVPWGTPVHASRKSLAAPRWIPDPGLVDALRSTVAVEGGVDFFRRAEWRRRLERVLEEWKGPRGRREGDEEFRQRIRGELESSRRVISEGLGRSVDFLCWPGGGRNPVGLEVAEEVGYRATTTHYGDPDLGNGPGQDPRRINRIGCMAPWVWRGRVLHHTPPELLTAALDAFRRRPGGRARLRLQKARALAIAFARGGLGRD